ncbi:MAG: phage tail protein [Acidobacteria bacterium]|nr:phage tail protein [Acidobacteriota bacterium]
MLVFPKLRTGAAAQYGVRRGVTGEVRVLPFVDGTEQRYPLKRQRRRWRIRLDQLDEGEAGAVEEFVRRHMATLEPFEFTDPQTGAVYAQCVVEGDGHELEAWAAGDSRVDITISETEE